MSKEEDPVVKALNSLMRNGKHMERPSQVYTCMLTVNSKHNKSHEEGEQIIHI